MLTHGNEKRFKLRVIFWLQINGRISVSKTCHIVAKVARDGIRDVNFTTKLTLYKDHDAYVIFNINEKKPCCVLRLLLSYGISIFWLLLNVP